MIAEETRKSVQAEEAKASEKARIAEGIAEDAQTELNEALPALDAALTSLKSLNKNDVTEVRRALQGCTISLHWRRMSQPFDINVSHLDCCVFSVGASLTAPPPGSEAGD